MLIIRCKDCNSELQGHPTKTKCCGCPNMTTIRDDKVSALDLTRVVMVNSYIPQNGNKYLTSQDLQFQEERRKRKVKKLDFEIR